jgi:hypothetical protein
MYALEYGRELRIDPYNGELDTSDVLEMGSLFENLEFELI